VHDEALNAAGEVINITQVRRGGLPTKGWRCAGESPDGAQCLRPVTACALDSEFKAPYFAGSHIDGCSRRSKRSDDEPGDRGYVTTAGPRVSPWRVSVDDAPSVGPSGRRRPDDAVPGNRTQRSSFDRAAPPRAVEEPHALSAFLDAALHGHAPERAALPLGPLRKGVDLIVAAADASAARFDDGELIVWGRVVATRETPYGGTMLVLDSAADGLAVLIRGELRGYYPLADDAEFIGRYVMTYGRRLGSDARPYVAVPKPRAVAFSPTVLVRALPRPRNVMK